MNDIEDLVLEALKKYKIARKDDWILYAIVVQMINPNLINMQFGYVLKNHLQYKLPAFESVSRARRKLQALYDELCDAETRMIRDKHREEMKRYGKIKL